MPMPPSQWVVDLHSRIERGRASMSVRMDAPVVVKPDMVSKNASTKDPMECDSMKGRAPSAVAETRASTRER